MGIRPYIDDDLAAGRLVAPFSRSVPKGMRWYLVYRKFRAAEPGFAAFHRWITHAARDKATSRKRLERKHFSNDGGCDGPTRIMY
ncbi:MAG: hypothetical protein WDO24_03625 [Pseudomonadota bacterium]